VLGTGLVSLLVREALNGGVAHSLYYALMGLPALDKYLHGEIVAWGSIPQLLLAGEREEALRLAGFLDTIGIPSTLGAMGVPPGDPAFLRLLPQTLSQPDMAVTPCPVTLEMLANAVAAAEALGEGA
ncbi:MAG TPA: hypothetical protein VLA21_12120, partial [Candidatus Limnocylindria bacterium]|nr:hypothetical protein [Candidatus Limnocylindria bacterium]